MRIPTRILEHPIESALAGVLLMALLFVSIGQGPQAGAVSQPVQQVADKM